MMNEIVEQYKKSFESFESRLNGETGGPLHALRTEAMGNFSDLGFPTLKNEEWRFTNIHDAVSKPFLPSLAAPSHTYTKADIDRLAAPARHRLVFLNGYLDEALSDMPVEEGAIVGNLSAIKKEHPERVLGLLGKNVRGTENGFTALNTSFMSDGFCLILPKGIALQEPVAIVYLSTGDAADFSTHPRNLIALEAGASATILEYFTHDIEGSYLTNSVTEIVLGEQARLEHDKIQLESLAAFHFSTVHIHQSRGGVYVSNNIALGGSIARTDITALLDDEGCECTLNGLSLGNGKQLIDNHTTIDHAKPNCHSWEMYKAVLDGKARGVFNGKIFVRKDAQKTDAKQTNQTLLLSDEAVIDTKPQLEIFADDVKCTHGATIGQLDDEQIFYLRSRGISEEDARDLLTFAFAGEVVAEMHFDSVKERLEEIIHARLDEGRSTHTA
jgi:Fe-S cluster assembly protein SufD